MKRAVRRLLEMEGVDRRAEVSVVLVGDDRIRDLNRKWRGVDEATDVLAFPCDLQTEEGSMPLLLGDIVISVDTARQQAVEAGRSFGDEMVWLCLHGCLHLLGYEDDTEEGRRQMEGRARCTLQGMER